MNDMNPEDLNQLNRRFDELLTRLDAQDKLSLERAEAQYKLAQFLKTENTSIRSDLTQVKNKMDPIYKIFVDMSGFSKVTVTILKFLGLLGAATAGYLILKKIFGA